MGAGTSSNRAPAQGSLPVPNGVSTQQLHQSYQRLGHNTEMSVSRRSPYSTGPDGAARPVPTDLPLAEYSTTRTIRSQCNIRRDSIQLAPVPGQPYEYDFSFLFDCGADTSVSIHFLACDRVQGPNHVTQQIDSCYTGTKPLSQLRSPGLRQKFVLPADQRLNVRASGELWLKHSVEACAYPIIIILSTNGSPDPVTGVCCAHSQTTYLTLSGSLEAGLSTSVAKQKLEYEDTPADGSAPRRKAFELKEIYGCDMLKPTECVICMSAPRDTTVLPCRHLCVCKDCAIEMQTSSHKCPMCRQPVESLLTISISRDAIAGAGAAQDERLDMPSASQ